MRKQYGTEWSASAPTFMFLLLVIAAPIATHAQGAPGTITSIPGTEGCSHVTANAAGDLYLEDEHGVQKLAAGTGRITTLASRDVTISGGGIAVDAAGNLYVAQGSYGPLAHTIKKVAAGTGAITTFAGTGEPNKGVGNKFGGPATLAIVDNPMTLAFDGAGNLYIGHGYGNPWKITVAMGTITGIQLSLYPSKRGEPVDKLATSVRSLKLDGFAFDSDGSLYMADSANNVVWKVAPNGGLLQRVAGSVFDGYSGENGPATEAKLSGPTGLAFDAAGNLYIADTSNNRIRMVAKNSGIITTVAGNGTSRNLYVSVTDAQGNSTQRYQKANDGDGGPATQARITYPNSIAFDQTGNLYLCGGILRKVNGVGTH